MTVNNALYLRHPEMSIKLALGQTLFSNSMKTLGTERHKEIDKAALDATVSKTNPKIRTKN